MPRFYFDIRDGETFLQDDEGLEFPDVEAARHAATVALGEMAKDALPGRDRHRIAIEVRSTEGPMLAAELTFAVQSLR